MQPDLPGGGSGAAYLYVEDADALYRERSGPGAQGVTRRPVDISYLLREGDHHYPDGNEIRFGSRSRTSRCVSAYLENAYGIEFSQLLALDSGVFRVDRRDGAPWVARQFGSSLAVEATRGDAEILRSSWPATDCMSSSALKSGVACPGWRALDRCCSLPGRVSWTPIPRRDRTRGGGELAEQVGDRAKAAGATKA
jgi:hypothetical protein